MKHERPHALARKLDQPDLCGRCGRCVNTVSKICFTPVDAAHHRHAAEQHLAEIEQRAPDQVRGQEAEQGQAEKATISPKPGIGNGR